MAQERQPKPPPKLFSGTIDFDIKKPLKVGDLLTSVVKPSMGKVGPAELSLLASYAMGDSVTGKISDGGPNYQELPKAGMAEDVLAAANALKKLGHTMIGATTEFAEIMEVLQKFNQKPLKPASALLSSMLNPTNLPVQWIFHDIDQAVGVHKALLCGLEAHTTKGPAKGNAPVAKTALHHYSEYQWGDETRLVVLPVRRFVRITPTYSWVPAEFHFRPWSNRWMFTSEDDGRFYEWTVTPAWKKQVEIMVKEGTIAEVVDHVGFYSQKPDPHLDKNATAFYATTETLKGHGFTGFVY